MISRETSSPPDASAASTPGPPSQVIPSHSNTPPPTKKRKHGNIKGTATAASSPAPSEAGFGGQETPNPGVVAANVQASSSRPRLDVARGPVFVPSTDGSSYHTTDQIAVNHLGFRYVPAGLAEPGSKIPFRTIESAPRCTRISWEDRSPFLRVTTDGLGLCGEKGFRSARCNVPIREGNWYMEVKVNLGGGDVPKYGSTRQGAHVRLGWGRREATLNGPVGLDGYSYGYRDKTGERITLSRLRPYGTTFGSGDVIGMYISLPPKRQPRENDPYDPATLKRERIAIEFKGQEYFESVEYPHSKEMSALMDAGVKAKTVSSVPTSSKKSTSMKNPPERGRGAKPVEEGVPALDLPTLGGSHIVFFVNGKCQGIAFQDLYDYLQLRAKPSSKKAQNRRKPREGMLEHTENPFDDGWLGYYPFMSLFNGAEIRVNTGPDFEFPPPLDIESFLANDMQPVDSKERTWRPICERYAEFMKEQWIMDAHDEDVAMAVVHMREKEDDADKKKAMRKEKKRLSEQKRRHRKAEELKAAKVKEKMDVDGLLHPNQSGESIAGFTRRPTPLGLLPFLAEEHKASPAPTTPSSVEPEDTYTQVMSGERAQTEEYAYTTDNDEKREVDDDAMIS